MLHEIIGVADEPPARRRWFHDDFFDLFVWQTREGEVILFQLCYGIASSEQALVWHRQGGFFHDGMEPGARDGHRHVQEVMARFAEAAHTVPKMIRQTVEARLQEYLKRNPAAPTRRRAFRRAAWQKRLAGAKSGQNGQRTG